MRKCKQITELVSKNLDTVLPWYQRLGIRLHLLMCKTCHHYAEQIGFIHRAVTEIDKRSQAVKLPDEVKKRIAEKLKQAK